MLSRFGLSEEVGTMLDSSAFSWPAFSVATAGWMLVAVFILAVWRGKMVPRATHDDVLKDRDDWRSESRIKDEQISEKDRQLRYLSEVGEVQKAVLTALDRMNRETG